MKATEIFLARPRLTAVAVLAAVLAGAMSCAFLPVSLYPSLVRPKVSVSCSYPGANAVELLNTVAGPLEEKVNGVEGMSRMTSSCYDSGAYDLAIAFDMDCDRDVAMMKVQSKVQQAMSLLPQEVKNIGVTVESGTTEELGILTLRSADGRLTHDQVADFVFGVVNPAVLRVSGVAKSSVKDDKIAVRVWMKPERLAACGLCSEDVVSAIKAQNVQASLGSVGARPSDGGERVMTLVSKGRLSSPKEFGEIVVATDAKGGLVRLKDIAKIRTGQQGYSFSSLYGESPSVYIVIYLLPGANPIETMAEVKSELKKLEPFFPADLIWDMTYDTTEYMIRALQNLGIGYAVALVAVFVALCAALRSVASALLALLSLLVPSSLTAVAMLAAGFPVTLPALYSFLAMLAFAAGMAAWALSAVRKGRLPGMEHVAAAAVVACAALPLMLIDGVQGVLFRHMAFVTAAMAVFSAFNSILVVPVAARRLLKPMRQSESAVPAAAPRFALETMVAILLGLVAYVVYGKLPKEFVPDEDMGMMFVDCKTAEGTSMSDTADVMRRLCREVSRIEGVAKCSTLLGESVINGAGENQAKMLVVLDDWRKRGPDASSYAIGRRIHSIAADIPEVEAFVMRTPPVKGMGTQNGVSVVFQAVGDNDPMKLSREVLRMRGELEKSPLAETVNGGYYTDTPHLRVVIDRAKCELMKVPMSSIYTVLQHNLGSVYVNDVNLGTQVNRVTVMADWRGRARPDDVKSLYVRSKTGAMVPLDALVTCHEEVGPRACYRCDQYMYCSVQFIPKPGVSMSEAIEEILAICRDKLSPGFINDWAGVTYEALKSRGDEGLLACLSLLLAYFALVVCKETWRGAFSTMLSSAAAVFGAMLALSVSGVSFAVYSRFALALLVATTAAMSVFSESSASIVRRAFMPLLAAVAVLPLVFSSGAGSVGNRSLGVTLLGGYLAYAAIVTVRLKIGHFMERMRSYNLCRQSEEGRIYGDGKDTPQ